MIQWIYIYIYPYLQNKAEQETASWTRQIDRLLGIQDLYMYLHDKTEQEKEALREIGICINSYQCGVLCWIAFANMITYIFFTLCWVIPPIFAIGFGL